MATKETWQDPEYRARKSAQAKAQDLSAMRAARWTPERRARQTEIMRARMADPEKRAAAIAARSQAAANASRKERPGEKGRHGRVIRVRGRARQHLCEHCGGPALDWATLHGHAGLEPSDYIPLCRRCHIAYDRVGISDGTRGSNMRRKEGQ